MLYNEKYSNIELETKRINKQILSINQQIDRFYAAIGKGLDSDETIGRIQKLITERENLQTSLKLLKTQSPWTKDRTIKFILANKSAASDTSKTAYAKFLINKFVERIIFNPDDIVIEYKFGDVDTIGGGGGSRTPVRKGNNKDFSGCRLQFKFRFRLVYRRTSRRLSR